MEAVATQCAALEEYDLLPDLGGSGGKMTGAVRTGRREGDAGGEVMDGGRGLMINCWFNASHAAICARCSGVRAS